MYFPMSELRQLEAEKLVRISKHETLDLYTINYSEHTQLGRLWDRHPALVHSRGLVVDGYGTVVGKPFRKFGNIGEFDGTNITTLSAYDKVEVSEKLDGSMILLTQYQGNIVFNTRGTFYSDQAIAAQQLWQTMRLTEPLDPELSYVFEYTAPDNRIVVRYAQPQLTLIGVINTHTGVEYSYAEAQKEAERIGIAVVGLEDITDSWQNLTKLERDNFEGFVLFFPEQQIRVKIKLEEYLVLHRIRSNMTEKFVYDALASGADLAEMYNILEAEDKEWFTTTVNGYTHKFQTMVAEAQAIASDVTAHNLLDMQDREQRKAAVMFIQLRNPALVGLVLDILDRREYTNRVWKMLK